MKYQVWIKDRKEETLKEIDVPLATYKGIKVKRPSPMTIRDTACSTGVLEWKDYTKIRFKKL